MPSPKWTILLSTAPAQPEDARQEARWLKLADDALANGKHETEPVEQLHPGREALRKLENSTTEAEHVLRDLENKEKGSAL